MSSFSRTVALLCLKERKKKEQSVIFITGGCMVTTQTPELKCKRLKTDSSCLHVFLFQLKISNISHVLLSVTNGSVLPLTSWLKGVKNNEKPKATT